MSVLAQLRQAHHHHQKGKALLTYATRAPLALQEFEESHRQMLTLVETLAKQLNLSRQAAAALVFDA